MGLVRRKSSLEGQATFDQSWQLLKTLGPQAIITDDHRHPGATLSGGGHFGAKSLENQDAQTEPQILLPKALVPAGALWCLGGEDIVIYSLSQQVFIVCRLVPAQRDAV